jgi:hypothetical protein
MKSKKYLKKRKQTRKKQNLLFPVVAAVKSLHKTGSVLKAIHAYKKQALYDARQLFGTVTV